LGVPNTWFEYEQELSTELVIALDQANIPENIRPFNMEIVCVGILFEYVDAVGLEEDLVVMVLVSGVSWSEVYDAVAL